MTSEHPRYTQWDAAYLLGALSPAERREYEEHLVHCAECRGAVSELSPLPGLLARLARERAIALLGDELGDELGAWRRTRGGELSFADAGMGPRPEETRADAGADARAGHPEAERTARAHAEHAVTHAGSGRRAGLAGDVLHRHRGERRRRVRARLAKVAPAAAVAVALILVIVALLLPRAADDRELALEPVSDAPLSATVTLTPAGWGTRVELDCRYEGTPSREAPPGGWPYALYLIDDAGAASAISSWRAGPGESVHLDAGTIVDLDAIAALEIRSLDGDTTYLRGAPAG